MIETLFYSYRIACNQVFFGKDWDITLCPVWRAREKKPKLAMSWASALKYASGEDRSY